jgi:hypothetical protein
MSDPKTSIPPSSSWVTNPLYGRGSPGDSAKPTPSGPGGNQPLPQAMSTTFPPTPAPPRSPNDVRGDAGVAMPQPAPPGKATTVTGNIQLAQIPAQSPPLPQLTLPVSVPGQPDKTWTPDVRCLGKGDLKKNAKRDDNLRSQCERVIAQKVADGAHVADMLMKIPVPVRMTEKRATDLMWYLQARGELKTNTPNAPEITYSLPDPHGIILMSLDLTFSVDSGGGLAYGRDASHLKALQKADSGNAPRGIDFPVRGNNIGDMDQTLPNGKATILYQRMTTDFGFPENRLFIKPENHGMYLSKPINPDPNSPERSLHLLHDAVDGLGHAFGFFKSVGRILTDTNSPAGSFKERVSPELKNEYRALMSSAPSSIAPTLSADDPLGDSSGLHVMLTNVRQALNRLDPSAPPAFKQALQDFQTKYLHSTNPVYDNPTLRIGQEIIFNRQDLAIPGARRPQTAAPPLPVTGAQSRTTTTATAPQQPPPQNPGVQPGTTTTRSWASGRAATTTPRATTHPPPLSTRAQPRTTTTATASQQQPRQNPGVQPGTTASTTASTTTTPITAPTAPALSGSDVPAVDSGVDPRWADLLEDLKNLDHLDLNDLDLHDQDPSDQVSGDTKEREYEKEKDG